jgi:hypothetical protein
MGMAFVPLLPCHPERSEGSLHSSHAQQMQGSFAALRMTELFNFQIKREALFLASR